MTLLLWINVLLTLVALVFVAICVIRTDVLTAGVGPSTPLARFYIWMYAARGLPVSVVTIAVVLHHLSTPADLRWWLVLAGVVQLFDVAIGSRYRLWGMAAGAGAAAVVHLVTAALV